MPAAKSVAAKSKAKPAPKKRGRPRSAEEVKPVEQTTPVPNVEQEFSEHLRPSELREAREQRVDPLASELKAARDARDEPLIPRERDPIPDEIARERTGFASPAVDTSAAVAHEKDQLRREAFRQWIDEEEAKTKRRTTPQMPMTAHQQNFRMPDISRVPFNKDGSNPVPSGESPKWVGTRDTASAEGHDSMAQVEFHKQFGYHIVRDSEGRPIVTNLGVLMSATFKDAAVRENYLTPQGSMRTGDVAEELERLAEDTNRRAGKRIATVKQMPDHGRHYSDRLRED